MFCGWPEKRPLKLGILQDLEEACPEIPRDVIVKALILHCSDVLFQVALSKPRAARDNLHGRRCGAVSDVAARNAAQRVQQLTRRVKKVHPPATFAAEGTIS